MFLSWTPKEGQFAGWETHLGVENIFDQRLKVRDGLGETPLSYQPDYLDPLGRTFRISLRKILY